MAREVRPAPSPHRPCGSFEVGRAQRQRQGGGGTPEAVDDTLYVIGRAQHGCERQKSKPKRLLLSLKPRGEKSLNFRCCPSACVRLRCPFARVEPSTARERDANLRGGGEGAWPVTQTISGAVAALDQVGRESENPPLGWSRWVWGTRASGRRCCADWVNYPTEASAPSLYPSSWALTPHSQPALLRRPA